MKTKSTLLFLILFGIACNNNSAGTIQHAQHKIPETDNPYSKVNQIPLPPGFSRLTDSIGSFTRFLQNAKLKKSKTVLLYNGEPKQNQTAQFAILDITTGRENLQQCADAVMRLRAEYLFAQKKFNEIIFFDNNTKAYQFTAPYSRENFNRYLKLVFGMCGTASLSKQLKPVTYFNSLRTGDVIIRGGFPGHAVIVMDVAENNNGEKIYLLAQSYMPAQDIHILKNPTDEKLSPWYLVTEKSVIQTPEYVFTTNQLMHW